MIQNCWNSPVARRVVPLGCCIRDASLAFFLPRSLHCRQRQPSYPAVGCGWRITGWLGCGEWLKEKLRSCCEQTLGACKNFGKGRVRLPWAIYLYMYTCILSCLHPRPGISIEGHHTRGWLTMRHSSFGTNSMVGKPAVRCLSSMRMWPYASFHQSPSPARHRLQQSRWGEAGLAFFQENATNWRMHEDATCVVDSCWFPELLFLQVLAWGLQPTQECSVGKSNPLVKTQKSQNLHLLLVDSESKPSTILFWCSPYLVLRCKQMNTPTGGPLQDMVI